MAQAATKEISALLTKIEGLKRGSSLVPSGIATAATGFSALDQLLNGGIPIGRLTEVVIHRGHRTTFLLSLATAATESGQMVAWVDLGKSLDLRGSEDAGLDLSRVLWVRPSRFDAAIRAADLVLASDGFGLVILDLTTGKIPSEGQKTQARPRSRRGEPYLAMDSSLWNRLAKRAEISGAALVVCTTKVRAGGAAALCLDVGISRPDWAGGGMSPSSLEGASLEITVAHQKHGAVGQKVVIPCEI